jgi:DNA polymerase I
MKIHPNSQQAYQLFHEGTLAFARAERTGIRVDTEYLEHTIKRTLQKIARLEKKFKESEFFTEWNNSTNKTININSGQQLGEFLYGVKGIEPKKRTPSGKGSTDEESIQQLNLPELKFYKDRTTLKKALDVLQGFQQEQIRGIIHPSFNLNLARTYRSSSRNPNFQNIPKRDKELMKTCRKALFPRPGHQLLEVDYSQLEVRIAACYHEDPVMLKYIKNPASDMHADMTRQLFKIDKFDKSKPSHKELRAATKNSFVFPQFYGDYYKNCAINLACKWGGLPEGKWKSGEGMEMEEGHLSDHMISKGFKNIQAYTKHVQKIEYDFWNNRFTEYQKWKNKWWAKYQRFGYTDLLTGFRCSGIMNQKDVINYPVQGAAFHCLLWSFIELDRIIQKKGLDTRLLGQIHDAIVLDVAPEELDYVSKLLPRVMCDDLRKAWKWITVPLEVEADISEIDESWADIKKYELP